MAVNMPDAVDDLKELERGTSRRLRPGQLYRTCDPSSCCYT